MSALTPPPMAGSGIPAEPGYGRPRRRRRRAVAAGAVAVAAGVAVAVAVTHSFSSTGSRAAAAGWNGPAASTAPVVLRSLSSQELVDATLGFAGTYTVTGQGSGALTWLPAAGRIIQQGGTLYRVDNGTPVFLLYGNVPAWRALSEGMTGEDVAQLNHDLVTMGYASPADMQELGWHYFGWETSYALQRLQSHLGLAQTGTLPLGQAVFLPSAIQVTAVRAALGSPASGIVLTATSTRRVVTIALNAAQQSEVKAGDKVMITLPDGASTPGEVSSVGQVAVSSGGSTTVTVVVIPSDPNVTGRLSQAPVQVLITTASVNRALVVPVDALLAQPGGGYAVEEVTAGGRHQLADVSPGLFDDADGLVQVTGSRLAAGQRVLVPEL